MDRRGFFIVSEEGLEPSHLSIYGPKPYASANSATPTKYETAAPLNLPLFRKYATAIGFPA